MDQQQVEQLEAEESMFVQTARRFTSDGATVTLQDVTPATLYFSDRPQRVVGPVPRLGRRRTQARAATDAATALTASP